MFIFISYRRGDSRHLAGRLRDHISWERGVADVFLDTQSIRPGEAFPARITKAVDRATHVLVFIGPGWDVARLFEPRDFVRQEIALALSSASEVIPILIDGASMPQPDQIPSELRSLVDRNGFTIHNDKNFPEEIKPLLRHLLGREPSGGDTKLTLAGKAIVGALLGLVAFLVLSAFVQFGLGLDSASLFAFTDDASADALWQLLPPSFVLCGAVAVPLLRRRWRINLRGD
jgi:TIR domain